MSKVILCLGMRRSGSTLQYNLIRHALSESPLEVHGTLNEPELSETIRLLGSSEEDGKYHLIKSHLVNIENVRSFSGQLYVFATYRDLRDIYLSFKEKVNLSINDYITQTHDAIRYYARLTETIPVNFQRYEELFENPKPALKGYESIFNLALADTRINEIVVATSVNAAIELRNEFGWKDRVKNLMNKRISRFSPRLRKLVMRVELLKKLRYRLLNPNIENPETLLHIDHISRFKGVPGSWYEGLTAVESQRITDEFQTWLIAHDYTTD